MRTTCDKCQKPSYAGCGRHVEQVLGDVPRADRCRCNEKTDDKAQASFFERFLR
jgi:hypothetical protein